MSTSNKPTSGLRAYVQAQLVADQPGLALAALRSHAPDPEASDFLTLAAQYETIRLAHTHPKTDPQAFRQRLNQLSFRLSQLACKLPAEAKLPEHWKPELAPLEWKIPEKAPPSAGQKQGISDQRFQWHILVLIVLVKLGIFGYMSILEDAGAFSAEQYQATLSVLIPVVAAYVGTMFKHLFSKKDPNQPRNQPTSYTSWRVQWLTYGVFALYALLYFFALTAEGKNAVEFKRFVFQINTIEAVFGVLIGYVVATLFKEAKEK
ncbi:MAG: hypothetical protein AAF399_21825 [Bacteroidota bacterium]